MRVRALLLVVSAVLAPAWPAPAQGAGPKTVAYVSAGPQIHDVKDDRRSSAIHTTDTKVADLTFGADGWLYFSEPAVFRIGRIQPGGKVAKSSGANETFQLVFDGQLAGVQPRELRLGADGSLLFTTIASGICEIDACALRGTCQPAVALPASASCTAPPAAGSGLAITHNGAPVYTNGNQIEGIASFTLSDPVGLGVASGGVNPGKADTRQGSLLTGEILVSAGKTVWRFKDDTLAAYASLPDNASGPAVNRAQYFEVALDDSVWLASATDPANLTNTPNGKLWRVDDAGVTAFWSAPKQMGKYPPSLAVALPPASRTIEESASALGTRTFLFGAHLFEASTPGSCALRVEARQVPAADAAGLASSVPNSTAVFSPLAYLGEESWHIHYIVTVLSGICGAPVGAELAGFLEGSFNQNLAMISCDGQPPACVQSTTGVWPFGVAPDDGRVGGGGDGFSTWFPARVEQVDQGSVAHNCGLGAPLSGAPIVSGPGDLTPSAVAAAPTFNLGRAIAFKFQLAATAAACGAGPYVMDAANYPDSGAMLSIMKLDAANLGNNVEFEIHPPGSANDPPLFRIGSGSSTHIFNLDTTSTAVAPWTGTTPTASFSLYAATISSLDGKFTSLTVLFKLTGE